MASQSIPRSSLTALNDNELEILHLLANGHTAKSIAAKLGRSEAAINERLRDARRKTGVSSSRELARLLDAQKMWDKNIDLARSDTMTHRPQQPRSRGFEWTKGKLAMMMTLPLAAIGLAFASGTAPDLAEPAPSVSAATMAQSPLAGRWSLDVGKIPEEERPAAVTITFTPEADGRWHTLVIIENRDGGVIKAESTAALDGVAVPVGGSMAEIDSVSLRQPEPDTLVMTLGKDGKRVSTRVYSVAEPGKSMTETIVWPSDGMPAIVTTTFKRVGESQIRPPQDAKRPGAYRPPGVSNFKL
jgi:DNA-binding CsgD family transcriptional regulator